MSEMRAPGSMSTRNQQIVGLRKREDTMIPALCSPETERGSSWCGERVEREVAASVSLPLPAEEAATLHDLANSLAALLVHARVLEWKLPLYSRLKRPVHEIERHAQRGGGLLQRLLQQWQSSSGQDEASTLTICGPVPSLHGTMAEAAAQGPEATAAGQAKLPSLAPSSWAPGFFPSQTELTSTCDRCTSTFFPKEER